jgi:hypothetical protein
VLAASALDTSACAGDDAAVPAGSLLGVRGPSWPWRSLADEGWS